MAAEPDPTTCRKRSPSRRGARASRRSGSSRSLAALVAIGIAVAARSRAKGPTITITFKSADGIEAGKTFVKYKEVNIGQVTGVRLTDDAAHVEVTAKIAKSAAQPHGGGREVLGRAPAHQPVGHFRACRRSCPATTSASRRARRRRRSAQFTGLEVPPIITGGIARPPVRPAGDATWARSASARPSITGGCRSARSSPTTWRPTASRCVIRIFVNAPYDKYVTGDTRFWNASGVDVSLSAPTASTCARNRSSRCSRAASRSTRRPIRLRPPKRRPTPRSRSSATASTAMKIDESIATQYVMYFTESVRGLSVGAPVSFFGVAGGRGHRRRPDASMPKTLDVRPRVEVLLYPERVIAQLPAAQEKRRAGAGPAGEPAPSSSCSSMVEQRGLRAQLATGSLRDGPAVRVARVFPERRRRRRSTGARPRRSCPRSSARCPRSRRSSGASSTSSSACRSTRSAKT